MMPTTRRRISKPIRPGITPEAIEAWTAGDYWRLWAALALPVTVMPDWSADPPYKLRDPDWPPCVRWYEQVIAAKAQLVELAGPPPKRWRYR